ncbi:MAG: VCBS repeat-containing protein, partial [Chitinophagaceae bacterium]|nr:VCBS repeat-containing protein [Chitinophagaceae bacterium]
TTTGTPNLIDFDADGDLDFFVSNILYKKNETGFSTIPISNFINYQSSWADIDNDGFADLIISGTENAIPTLKIYKNNNTAFAEITSILNITQHVVTDFDSDGDMDLFFSEIGHFYENKITVGNNSPNTPQGLDASASENGEILFSWSPVSDAETPSPGLSYNLLITKNESPHSFGGIRTHSTSASLTLLPGLYYWSVFATDTRKATSKSITKIYASIHNYPAKEIGSTSFTASWSKIKNIQTYEIHISTDKNFSLYEAYTTTDTFYTVKNLLVNTQYFYRISIPHFPGQSNPVINTFQTLNAFSLSVDTIHSLGFGTANFFDADNDKDLDVLFAGAQLSTPIQSSIFYNQNSRINQGVDVGLEGVSNSINALSDFNNDGIQDVFISGRTSSGWTPTGFLYNGNAAGFTENTAHNIFSQENGNIATGDYDNDGDIDIFIGGGYAHHSRLYRNDRTSGFTNVFPDGTFISIANGYAAFGDYDNDADLDLLVSNNKNIILYENKGTSGFSSFFHYTYYKFDFGNVSFVDYNNDGFLDIYVSAYFAEEGINPYYLEIDITSLAPYTNNISLQTNRIMFHLNNHYYKYYIPSPNYSYFYDVIKNKSVLKTGYRYSLLLENKGGVSFSKIIKEHGKNVYGSTSFGDFNNNGGRDLFQIGQVTVQDFISKNRNEPLCLSGEYDNQTTNSIYSGDACFSLQNDYKLCSYFFTSSRLIDDSDKQVFNFEDIHYFETHSYENGYTNTNKTHNSFGDIDNDGDLDIMIPNKLSTKIYLNNSAIKNTPPEQVNGLIASVYGAGKVAFVWQNSQDAQLVDSLSHKAYNGIDYNMYFGTSTNKNSIRSAQSHLDDGYRKISERGMIQGNIYKLENIPNGTYVWAMQAIDQGLTGGSWAMEQTVDIQNRVFFQSITFHPLAEKTFGDAPFTISATATSNLPVFFLSANTNVANVIGNTVTIVGAGETNIIAVQTGNALYYAAYPIQQLLKLKKAPQTITFPTIPTQTIGVPFVLNAYSNFLLPIQFSLSNRNYTSLQSNTVIIFQTGTFTATAFQNGNLDIRPADSVSQSLTVKFPQKITFFKISEKTYRDLPFVLQSRSSSSLPVSYSSAHTNITIQNNTVSIHGVGTASIVAFSNGNTEFFPTHTTHILTIKKARQSITFHPLSLRTLGHADSIVVLDASASSSLPISLRVSGHSVVVNANTLTIKTAGVILIEALQSGNENYETASSFQYLTVVDANKTNQTIDFAEIPNDTLQSFQDSVVIMLTATASSSLPVQYVLGASQYSLTRNPYIIREPGIYTITALQDGDSAFNPAPPVSQTFTVKRKQSIVFNPIPHKNYESTPFFINPYSLSGLDVQVSLSNNSIITLDPDYLVTVRNVGTVGITAKQRGNDEYYAADSITRILVVTKADQYFV